MIDILFAKTFLIVGSMLLLTSITAKVNRFFETSLEMWSSIIISFLVLFLILAYSGNYPVNLLLVGLFSLAIGWQIGPAIEYYGLRYKLRQYLSDKGIVLEKGQEATEQQKQDFEKNFDTNKYHKEWQNIIFQAVLGVALAVIVTSSVVYFTDIDFGFLGSILFISLILLIVMGLVNLFFIKSRFFSLVQSYLGAVVFTFYLLYDFDQLQQKSGDESWETAISISVNIYLDIINLFLDLLEILSESN